MGLSDIARRDALADDQVPAAFLHRSEREGLKFERTDALDVSLIPEAGATMGRSPMEDAVAALGEPREVFRRIGELVGDEKIIPLRRQVDQQAAATAELGRFTREQDLAIRVRALIRDETLVIRTIRPAVWDGEATDPVSVRAREFADCVDGGAKRTDPSPRSAHLVDLANEIATEYVALRQALEPLQVITGADFNRGPMLRLDPDAEKLLRQAEHRCDLLARAYIRLRELDACGYPEPVDLRGLFSLVQAKLARLKAPIDDALGTDEEQRREAANG
jgi:hypothetical protein